MVGRTPSVKNNASHWHSMQQWHRVVINGTTYWRFEVRAKVRKALRAKNAHGGIDLNLVSHANSAGQ